MHFSTSIVAIVATLSTVVQSFIVTGATGGISNIGARQIRQDIIKMQSAGGPAWDLYIQALQMFQQKNQTDQVGWFQFMGVHGYPSIPWDNVRPTQNPEVPGYAPHSSILFGPWHRIYLAGYEQLIQQNAIQIAARYPKSINAQYQSAATSLRIPYWDWANIAMIPPVVSQQTITINTPTGSKNIANPLAQFVFHPVPGADLFPQNFTISRAPTTERTPNSDGTTNTATANNNLQANGENLKDRVYLLMARQNQYAPFSNTGFLADQRNGSNDNLEMIHNNIHGLVGGNGHMSYIPFSAFDPIFWLHHCNIDRFLAIFSAINPSSYVVPQTNVAGTYAEAAGTSENANTPLYPFKKDYQGNFHTAVTARSLKNFAYSYPEIVDWGVTSQQLASNVRSAFKALYNPTGAVDNQKRTVSNASAALEWFVNLKVNRTMDTPVSIHFFLGSPPSDSAAWPAASNLIASQILLPDMTASKLLPPALAQIPLTRSLGYARNSGQLNGMDEGSVQAFLADQLQWTVSTAAGEVMEPGALVELQISILSQTVQKVGVGGGFGNYGALKNHTGLAWRSRN